MSGDSMESHDRKPFRVMDRKPLTFQLISFTERSFLDRFVIVSSDGIRYHSFPVGRKTGIHEYFLRMPLKHVYN